jgi:K+-transporting ATPase ATPase A chain
MDRDRELARLSRLADWLDSRFRIPGTNIRFGTDSIIGLLPFLGDGASVLPAGTGSVANPGPHGFSEILYAFSSAGNNNGSAFAGLGANTPFYNTTLGFAMLFGRYWLAIPTLAIAGSLARKNTIPPGLGTLPTHTPLFIGFLIGVVVLVGALTFIPALALGPIVEHLMITAVKP